MNLKKNNFTFNFKKQDKELREFIKRNFILTKKVEISKRNINVVFFKWLKEVRPFLKIDFKISNSDLFLFDIFLENQECLKINDPKNIKKILNNQLAYKKFWNIYKRPPRKDFWQYIIDRRDLLVPQDIRERKGSYFTPQIWVEKSQEYLMKELGENWQDEYFIWDCCAGTGNLLNGLTNKYNIWASTIDQADVDVMKDRIKNGANLLESHVFRFDFLNDSFDNLPEGLKEIINSEEKRKKLVIYINPPYAEAATKRTITGNAENKTDVAVSTVIYGKYKDHISLAARELFALFLIRINYEIPSCILANFSTLKLLLAPTFKLFRKSFTYRLNSLFLVEANTFDNVKGSFPIGFHIWKHDTNYSFSKIIADVFDVNGILVGKKTIINYDTMSSINDWIISTRVKDSKLILGFMSAKGCDFQNQNFVFIINNKEQLPHPRGTFITDGNLLECAVYLAVRKVVKPNWTDDRDQYIYPLKLSHLASDDIFKSDCLVYTLFSQSNNIKSSEGINYWIPFRESQINTKDVIESHFMSDFLKNLTLSVIAQDVLDSARDLYIYYHSQNDSNPNASYYDIRAYFQGKNDKGRLNVSSEDKEYTRLLNILKEKHRLLGEEIKPKVYEYGFLIK